MKILHLAYEDPRQPGSGGGSRRTVEINRRLAERHAITAVVAGYPGARPRVEDGVRYRPIGLQTGGMVDRLSYFALLGRELLRRRFDLVVEEFAAPFGPGMAPLYTRRPVVASVQWLFAREMRDKYHLPFDWVERHGAHAYDRFIAVSSWLATELRSRRGQASIEVIPNGVEDAAFAVTPGRRDHLLFLGRLDMHQKGGDLLFDILARIAATLGDGTPPLLIAGDGPDRGAMESCARRAGVADRVRFLGRVDGGERFRLMADAHAVLVPSRYETFGIVAVEAQAAGAPVVTFDVGPLAEVAGGGSAKIVAPFDLDAFARAASACVQQPALAEELGRRGRTWARRYNWDAIALQQEANYERARAEHRPRGRVQGRGA